jgi:hypothetical protein
VGQKNLLAVSCLRWDPRQAAPLLRCFLAR